MRNMQSTTLTVTTAALLTLVIAQSAPAAAIFATETGTKGSSWATGDEMDSVLATTISDDDLLEGIVPTSNPDGSESEAALTDGQAVWPLGRVIPSASPWDVTFSNLGGLDFGEIRVFTANNDRRAVQNYDVEYSTDDGSNFSTLIANVFFGDTSSASANTGRANLTMISDDQSALLIGGVTDLRFTFREGYPNRTPSIIEIDGLAPVPEPGSGAVPEPGSMALLAVAGLLTGLRRRTR